MPAVDMERRGWHIRFFKDDKVYFWHAIEDFIRMISFIIIIIINFSRVYYFEHCCSIFWGARRLSTPQEHSKYSLRLAVGKVVVAGPAGARICYP